VDLKTPGITIRPIRDLVGEEGFNEVTFDDVLLPDDALVGQEGAGWAQATSELAFERSGPDRYSFVLSAARRGVDVLRRSRGAVRSGGKSRGCGRCGACRSAVAGMLKDGEDPARQAAL
jgi:alkylation response protein AidB-like acyl-CoA dehydrogenase